MEEKKTHNNNVKQSNQTQNGSEIKGKVNKMSGKQANFEKKWAISDAKIHWLSIYAHILKSSVRISDSV